MCFHKASGLLLKCWVNKSPKQTPSGRWKMEAQSDENHLVHPSANVSEMKSNDKEGNDACFHQLIHKKVFLDTNANLWIILCFKSWSGSFLLHSAKRIWTFNPHLKMWMLLNNSISKQASVRTFLKHNISKKNRTPELLIWYFVSNATALRHHF